MKQELPIIYFRVDEYEESASNAQQLVDDVAEYFAQYGIDLWTEKNPNVINLMANRLRSAYDGLSEILNDMVVLQARNISTTHLSHQAEVLRKQLQFWNDNYPEVISEDGVDHEKLKTFFEMRATTEREAELFKLSTEFIQNISGFVDRFEELGVRDHWRFFLNNRKAQVTGRPHFDISQWHLQVCPKDWRK